MNYSRLVLPGALLLAIVFAGCSTADKKTAQETSKATSTKNGQLLAVSADSAAFFQRGPQAGREPDKTLPRETLVKLIRPSFGFSKVQLVASGEQGYVASDELKPASSTLIASTTARTSPDSLTPASTPAVEQFNLDSNDPRLVPPPEELPNPDLPAPSH
ncbi:MAG TPA: hypothetical protein VJU77_02765 [Chthoniobacterales bacterium]|nr:hypothetical protein [Chthoniobacterales bacterium]